ncbi:MAG: hypothetical protein LBJ64_03100, partial [Deltaproteobacteria bacterium]|nr:hypothetical protein [Deltaproteobacteria bacterium]
MLQNISPLHQFQIRLLAENFKKPLSEFSLKARGRAVCALFKNRNIYSIIKRTDFRPFQEGFPGIPKFPGISKQANIPYPSRDLPEFPAVCFSDEAIGYGSVLICHKNDRSGAKFDLARTPGLPFLLQTSRRGLSLAFNQSCPSHFFIIDHETITGAVNDLLNGHAGLSPLLTDDNDFPSNFDKPLALEDCLNPADMEAFPWRKHFYPCDPLNEMKLIYHWLQEPTNCPDGRLKLHLADYYALNYRKPNKARIGNSMIRIHLNAHIMLNSDLYRWINHSSAVIDEFLEYDFFPRENEPFALDDDDYEDEDDDFIVTDRVKTKASEKADEEPAESLGPDGSADQPSTADEAPKTERSKSGPENSSRDKLRRKNRSASSAGAYSIAYGAPSSESTATSPTLSAPASSAETDESLAASADETEAMAEQSLSADEAADKAEQSLSADEAADKAEQSLSADEAADKAEQSLSAAEAAA